MAMRLPRMARSSAGGQWSRSVPSNMARPLSIRPGGWGIRPSREEQVTDLPEPDSPTIPRVSPFSSEKLTPSTARYTPRRV